MALKSVYILDFIIFVLMLGNELQIICFSPFAKRRKPWGSSLVQKESPNQQASQISVNTTTKKPQRIRHRSSPTITRKAISSGVTNGYVHLGAPHDHPLPQGETQGCTECHVYQQPNLSFNTEPTITGRFHASIASPSRLSP